MLLPLLLPYCFLQLFNNITLCFIIAHIKNAIRIDGIFSNEKALNYINEYDYFSTYQLELSSPLSPPLLHPPLIFLTRRIIKIMAAIIISTHIIPLNNHVAIAVTTVATINARNPLAKIPLLVVKTLDITSANQTPTHITKNSIADNI